MNSFISKWITNLVIATQFAAVAAPVGWAKEAPVSNLMPTADASDQQGQMLQLANDIQKTIDSGAFKGEKGAKLFIDRTREAYDLSRAKSEAEILLMSNRQVEERFAELERVATESRDSVSRETMNAAQGQGTSEMRSALRKLAAANVERMKTETEEQLRALGGDANAFLASARDSLTHTATTANFEDPLPMSRCTLILIIGGAMVVRGAPLLGVGFMLAGAIFLPIAFVIDVLVFLPAHIFGVDLNSGC